jgi:hypothetical protein
MLLHLNSADTNKLQKRHSTDSEALVRAHGEHREPGSRTEAPRRASSDASLQLPFPTAVSSSAFMTFRSPAG